MTEAGGRAGRILLVCYGNLCRSPMAEGLLRARLGDSAWDVVSAGTHAVGGDPPTPLAQEAVRALDGADISAQRSQPLTVALLQGSAHIFTMSIEQAHLAAALVPEARGRIRLFGAFAPTLREGASSADPGGPAAGAHEVPDPMGGTPEEYRACARRLIRAADACVAWLLRRSDAAKAPPPMDAPGWPFALGA